MARQLLPTRRLVIHCIQLLLMAANVIVTIIDKNHTGLSPLRISGICGFVFTFNQVCPEGSMIIGLRIKIYFSHGFDVYSCIFGPYPSAQWFLMSYTNGPYQEIIALCITYMDSSTWYSSYMIHVGISFLTVATYSLH